MEEAPENLDKYREIGQELQRSCRFSYLYPSEQFGGSWRAWLPIFKNGIGLCWRREGNFEISLQQNRSFRGRLLDARPGTAIDPVTDSAAERSLHETEVINPWWRRSHKTEPVAMIGYFFCKKTRAFMMILPHLICYMWEEISDMVLGSLCEWI
jgi:hypothetical protein